MAVCSRHPNRETGVSCSNCGNPICPDCMTPTPVGMRCPDCSRQKTQVRTLRSMAVEPIATYILVAVNVAMFIGANGSPATGNDLKLNGPAVADGEWWRLVTSGFLHTEFWHVGLNMFALFWLGRMIEPALGHARFVAIYFASLLTGSLGVMLVQPNVNTLGASGAIFGLLGAAVVMARNRNIDLVQSGLLPILALNLGLTFLLSGRLSVGAHIGGLVGGIIVTWGVEELARRRRSSTVPAVIFCAIVGAAAAAASIATVS
jgi:membrane associated rhomboid family serine protease